MFLVCFFTANWINLGPLFRCQDGFDLYHYSKIFKKASASALSNIFEIINKKIKSGLVSKTGSNMEKKHEKIEGKNLVLLFRK
jgi:hypothetical protein